MSESSYLARLCAHTPSPNFAELAAVLSRKQPSRPTLFEFFLNGPLYTALAAKAYVPKADGLDSVRLVMWAFRQAGYDYFTYRPPQFCFPAGEHPRDQTISLNDGIVIADRASFQAYKWLEADACDYSSLDAIRPELPPGMKIVMFGPGGVLENVIRLVGYDNLCFILADDPDLAQDIFDAVGSRLVRHYEIACRYDTVGAAISNDDWGYKTQPMLSPADLRRYVFPWHQRIVEAIHNAGMPAILHSCGNASEIMDDVIDGMGYDGRHSYEDAIQPVEQAYEQYGGRIAVLGGMDVDFVVRSPPAAVYRRSREMLERSVGRGSYALGTGNSVPEYVPAEGYAAMVWAAVEQRRGKEQAR
jgi:uroporphyrinogen decarboxylase